MKKITSVISLLIVITMLAGLTASAQKHKADDILGTWLNEEATGKVTLYKENGKYFGKLVWLREPNSKATGLPRTDIKNPDDNLKKTPLIGMINMKNFSFDGDVEWSGGTIYDPKNGKTYKCNIQFETPTKLKIRGYVGVSMLGRNTYWTKSTPPQN